MGNISRFMFAWLLCFGTFQAAYADGVNSTGDVLPIGAGGQTVLKVTGSTRNVEFLNGVGVDGAANIAGGLYVNGGDGAYILPGGTAYFKGKVGIGTANPAAKLDVDGSMIVSHTLKVDGAGPINADSVETLNNLRDINGNRACGTGQVLTKNGPNSFACVAIGGGGTPGPAGPQGPAGPAGSGSLPDCGNILSAVVYTPSPDGGGDYQCVTICPEFTHDATIIPPATHLNETTSIFDDSSGSDSGGVPLANPYFYICTLGGWQQRYGSP
jgi:hypothetical protein